MVSIIKNQLLKHLSRFTKNLSADKINLSTFKGEGELTNLELDEIVLTDLLELPSWLRLTSAWCNKVSFRIQWTKLKSVPIFLSLDEVHIVVQTCEDLRSMSSPQSLSSYAGPAKYSFIHKVIDGITVAVNTVSVTFNSPAFIASVQMSRIMVESKSATWRRCDLRTTRLKDPERGQLLIFKELEWQTVRIEAQSTKDKNLTPLRLLTNQARCRITIKKRISDCFVMGSRLVLILDDLLWVLTDSQLKAALHFIDSLGGLIEKATILERKTKAARKLEVLPEYQAQISQQSRTKHTYNTDISKIFASYDVVETSYHFLSQRIDLHLSDDAGTGRSLHPDLKDGGALQISLVKFQIDYYPYHLAMADRKHWAKYVENSPLSQWLQQSLNSFRSQFMDLIDSGRTQHSPLTRSQGNITANTAKGCGENLERGSQPQNPNVVTHDQKKSQHPSGNPVKNYVLEQLGKLMTTCIIIRIYDFTLFKVTTTSRSPILKEFIAVPPPKFYMQLNPIQVNFDVCSCLWFNSFVLNLHYSLMTNNKDASQSPSRTMYFDVKVEAILPRIVFESQQDYPNQKDRPKSLHLQTARASITNVRSLERSSRADLAQCLNAFQMGQMFFGVDFPSKPDDYHVVTDKFLAHCAGTDNVRHPPPNFSSNSVNELMRQLHRELLWTEAKDVWCCNLEPVWGDFLGARAVGQSRPVPFVDAFPLTVWCHMNFASNGRNETSPFESSTSTTCTTETMATATTTATPVTAGITTITSATTIISPTGAGDSPAEVATTAAAATAAVTAADAATTTANSITTTTTTTTSTTTTSSSSADAAAATSAPAAAVRSASSSATTADIHFLAYISNLVSVQINHYQYLFLLRLSEVLSEMTVYLAIDSNKILRVETGGSLVLGALIPQLEVTFVMPSQTPGKENSGGDLESVVPDSSSIADDIAGSSTAWHSSTVNARIDFSGKRMNTSNDVETPQSEVSSMLSMDFPHMSSGTQGSVAGTVQLGGGQQQLSAVSQPVVTFKQNGTSTKYDHHQQQQQQQQVFMHMKTPTDKQVGAEEEEKSLLRHSGADVLTHKQHNKLESTSNTPFIPNNFNVGLSSVKKGFSTLMTSIDSALKASPEDGSSDTVSMRSDVSSDSENYILITLQEQEKIDAAFTIDNNMSITAVEEASEVVEETPDTQSEKSMDSVCKRKDIVSMTTFKLSKVEFIQQSSGHSSSIKLQVSNIGNDECTSIPWDEFQTKFSSRSRGWIELPSDSDCRSRIKLRLERDLKDREDARRLSQGCDKRFAEQRDEPKIDLQNRDVVMGLFEDKLDIKVCDVSMALSMSSVTGLADLAEDEIIPKPIPMQIYLENISLRLNEDRPPNNITSPGPIPIDLNISKLRVARDLNGVFHIEPVSTSGVTTLRGYGSTDIITLPDSVSYYNEPCNSRDIEREAELDSLRQSAKQLRSDNEELRRRIGTLERLSEENAKLMRAKEESDAIKLRLSAAQEDIAVLVKEKRILRDTITDLQSQMMSAANSNRVTWSMKR